MLCRFEVGKSWELRVPARLLAGRCQSGAGQSGDLAGKRHFLHLADSSCDFPSSKPLIRYTFMYNGCWDWDDAKNDLNIKKHGFDFWFAARIFEDPNYLILKERVDRETGEQRWHGIGLINGAVLTLSHTYRSNKYDPSKEIIQFISAFAATSEQVRKYITQDLE